MLNPERILETIGFVMAATVIIVTVLLGYVKAPPDKAFIISGFRKPRTLIGRAGLRIPFLERLDKLSLKMFSVDVKTTDFVPNAEYINVKVDATVKIRIGQSEVMMTLAAKFFLNEDEEAIIHRVQDTLEGNMREIIGQMKLSEMVTDRKAFGERVQANAVPDLERMGLELMSFNVQSFSDQSGVIDNLGIDNVSRIKKDASIAKAQADRDIAIAQAKAAKEANDAKVQAEMEIAEKKTALSIREAELKKQSDVKQAEADAAYDIQKQEQRRTIEIASANADIAKAEREAELKAKEVDVARKALDAEVRARADADRYRQEQEAQAALFQRQKEAEARRYEQEQEAEAVKAKAEAEKFAREQDAAGITAVGKAEAEAIEAKALAEAQGIDKKAEAMRKYGEAAIVEMVMNALPDIARNVAEPLSKVDKIMMYGNGNTARLIEDIVRGTTQASEGILAGFGLDLKELLNSVLGGTSGKRISPAEDTIPSPSFDTDASDDASVPTSPP